MVSLRVFPLLYLIVVPVLIAGCGGETGSGVSSSEPSSSAQQSPAPIEKSVSTALQDTSDTSEATRVSTPIQARVTASISSPEAAAAQTPESGGTEPVTDDASSILKEIQQLRLSPVPGDLEQARKTRRERNERIVELATNVLRLTMNDAEKEPLFHQGISQLLEARFQMALAGQQADVDQLYADVEAIAARDPKSPDAAEGIYYIARFAHTKAGMHGKTQPEWFTTLSQWAREFADRFPDQQNRAVTMLFGAALSCELHATSTTDEELSRRLMTESKLCYTLLAEKFPQSTQGQKATATLRRMNLAGQPLSQFSGPTLDGGFVSVDDFSGKPALIYFWSSEDKEFVDELLPLLQKIRSQVPSDRLRMVGVALDDVELELNAFMELHPVPGQQIFFPNPDQRSWNSPLVVFWGIARSPAIWLVNSQGVVVSTSVDSRELGPMLQNMLKQ